jgi:hypothetical protein
MRFVWAFLVAAILWPAASAASGLNPSWGVIFPAAQAPTLARQCSRAAPRAEGVWLPTPADIARLEPGLARVLADAKVQPGAYYRQYGGLVVGGRHIVYVNGARNAVTPADWRTSPISICDGGALAFGVEYDPASGAFANFAFDGHL